jgi:hypothetical protein
MDDKNILRKTALEDKVARDGDKPEAWSSYFFSQHGSHFKSMILDAAGEAWNDSQHNSVDGIYVRQSEARVTTGSPAMPPLEAQKRLGMTCLLSDLLDMPDQSCDQK